MTFHGHIHRISKLIRQQVMEPDTPVYKGPEKPVKPEKLEKPEKPEKPDIKMRKIISEEDFVKFHVPWII